MLLPLTAALAVTVQPAFELPCRPGWNAGAAVIEASNDGEARRVSVEMVDYQGQVAEIALDLPARSHKRLVAMPPISGRVTVTLVDEDGTRTPLAYPFRQECAGPAIAAFRRQDGRAGFALPAASGSVGFDVGAMSREDLGEWRPLMALDAIAAEARALGELAEDEREAIRRWVLSGGVLLVVPGLDPKPLFSSGWLPADLPTGERWASRPWGAGAVAITDDVADPRIGGLVLVTAASRAAWMRGIGGVFEAQRDSAGPMGRFSQPAGLLSLGAFLLLAAIAHELLRRHFVAASRRDFRGYFRGVAITLAIAAVSGMGAALAGRSGAGAAGVVVAHRSGWGIRTRAVVLPPRSTRELAPGAWPLVEPQVRMASGARSSVTNGAGATRVVLERLPVVLGEGIALDASATLVNRSGLDFAPGVLAGSRGCQAVGALPSNGQAAAGMPGCLETPDVRIALDAAQALSMPVYAARAGATLYLFSMEPP